MRAFITNIMSNTLCIPYGVCLKQPALYISSKMMFILGIAQIILKIRYDNLQKISHN